MSNEPVSILPETPEGADPEALALVREPGSVCIIGCKGRMGAMLMREGRTGGLGMQGIDQPLTDIALHHGLARAKVVILCVPAAVFSDVLRKACRYLPEDCVVADITSVKAIPMIQMAALWKGNIVGTHPLFGPNPDRAGDLPVVLCPGKHCSKQSVELVRCIYLSMGFTTFQTTPVEHDQAMARIQNMNFITTLAYLAMTAGKDDLLPYITPSFKRRLDSARKLLTEDGPMFSGLFEANPYSQDAVRQFSKYLSLAAAGDIDLLLSRADWWWQQKL